MFKKYLIYITLFISSLRMQKLNELEEKIKTTKKRIKDHDDGLRKKQQETLNVIFIALYIIFSTFKG